MSAGGPIGENVFIEFEGFSHQGPYGNGPLGPNFGFYLREANENLVSIDNPALTYGGERVPFSTFDTPCQSVLPFVGQAVSRYSSLGDVNRACAYADIEGLTYGHDATWGPGSGLHTCRITRCWRHSRLVNNQPIRALPFTARAPAGSTVFGNCGEDVQSVAEHRWLIGCWDLRLPRGLTMTLRAERRPYYPLSPLASNISVTLWPDPVDDISPQIHTIEVFPERRSTELNCAERGDGTRTVQLVHPAASSGYQSLRRTAVTLDVRQAGYRPTQLVIEALTYD